MGEPKGCIVVLAGPTGATFVGTSFERDRYGGFNLKESQRYRARASVCRDFIRRSCSAWILDAVDSYDIEKMVEKLLSKKDAGWSMSTHYVGHEDAGADHE